MQGIYYEGVYRQLGTYFDDGFKFVDAFLLIVVEKGRLITSTELSMVD